MPISIIAAWEAKLYSFAMVSSPSRIHAQRSKLSHLALPHRLPHGSGREARVVLSGVSPEGYLEFTRQKTRAALQIS